MRKLTIYNTLSRTIEEFKPQEEGIVRMYNCGPTVYNYLQIGNWRAYIFVDIVRRGLTYLGYKVDQVMNITDVGHLTSDGDSGEDKMEKGAKRENKTVWEVAQFYIDDFLHGLDLLHIERPKTLVRATDHIPEQIAMIEKILANKSAYETSTAVYFDVTSFPTYTNLNRQPLADKYVGVRDEIIEDAEKHHPQDFRLWQKDPERTHQMVWDSPWGVGYPGWHIECSAMAVKYLGQPIDIHTGGVDHISVHHTNEIAQAETANPDKTPYVRYWMHNEFLTINGGKMGKSLGNAYTLEDIDTFLQEALGYHSQNFPLALRYFFLIAHYRNKVDFTIEGLIASFHSLFSLYRESYILFEKCGRPSLGDLERYKIDNEYNILIHRYYKAFLYNIEDDFSTAGIIAKFHLLFDEKDVIDLIKLLLILEYDKVLGLGIYENFSYISNFSEGDKLIMEERKKVRDEKDFTKSDELRDTLMSHGIDILDERTISRYYRR